VSYIDRSQALQNKKLNGTVRCRPPQTTITMIQHLDHPATLLGVQMQRSAVLALFSTIVIVVFSIVVELTF
jgi:hypothetical protein